MAALSILWEDYHVVAVNKPAPLLTQAPPGIPSLEAAVKDYVKDKYHKPGNVYLGIPHRLDRPVSGVVVFARNTKAARRLAEQFQTHTVEKVYWAVVTGIPEPAEGVWEDWLVKLPDVSLAARAEPGDPKAKRAELAYRVLQVLEGGRSLLELRPRTGRMHQLRLQSSLRGFPVVGDNVYGSTEAFGPPYESQRAQTIALHARRLSFDHPVSRDRLTLEAPLPETWAELHIASTRGESEGSTPGGAPTSSGG